MLYRPYQRAEHAKESEICDIYDKEATKPQSLAENPSRREIGRRWRCFLQHLNFLVLTGTVFWSRWCFGNRCGG